MSKRFAFVFGLLLVMSIITTACGSSPVSAEKPSLGSCPVPVRVNLYARTPHGGGWEGGNWMGYQLLEVGTTEFTSRGYDDTPENYNGGAPNWRFDSAEQDKYDQYFVTDVEPTTAKFNSNIAKVFAGFNTFHVAEFIQRDAIYDTWIGGHIVGYDETCPEGGFPYEISLYIKDASLEQTDIADGKVYFRYTTTAGSTFNFWLSEKTFVAILTEGYTGHNPVSMTTSEVEPYLYSGEITRRLMSDGAVEMGSYSIVPEDSQGRAEIYALVQKVLRYATNDVVVLNTFDTEGEQNSKLLGSIITVP